MRNTAGLPPGPTYAILLEMSDTVSYINDKGLIETVNIYTGETIAVQSTKDDLLKMKQEKMVQVQMADGSLMWLERGLNLDSYAPRRRWSYSELVIDLICTKLLEGKSLKAICEEPGMPPMWVLSRWRRKYAEADQRIKDARMDYAEIIRDQIIEEALAADEDTVQTTKVRMDALKWAAGVDNPDRYGSKARVAVEGSMAMQLLVDTGIRRPEDEAESNAKQIPEVSDGKYQNEAHAIGPAASVGGGGDSPADYGVGVEGTGCTDSGTIE